MSIKVEINNNKKIQKMLMMEAKKKKGGGSALGFMLFICYKSLGVYFQAESLRSLVSTRTILESYLHGMK